MCIRDRPYTLANLENYPGTSVKIPGGLRLLHVHTKYYKDALHRKLSIAPADPGACLLYTSRCV